MKVTLLNTFSSGGGAAIACQRLFKALQGKVEYSILSTPEGGRLNWLKLRFRLGLEKLSVTGKLRDKENRFIFDTNTKGLPLSTDASVLNADILHLHWINHGFVSMEELNKMFALDKPVVWTLHDMWTFTGGCHYSRGCTRYEKECGTCPFLKGENPDDLSHQVWLQKQKLFRIRKPYIVTCSNWLADEARKSSLLRDCNIRAIPNPINTSIFKPSDKVALRKKLALPLDKKLILFSSARLDDPRKGIQHLVNSLNIVHREHPEWQNKVALVLMGSTKNELPPLPYPIYTPGFISGDEALAGYYAACDVFVLPSTEDNLPNTVMEALACGTPAVAFNNGGLPDLIEHGHTGYLAAYKNDDDFANGILFLLEAHKVLSALCREKTMQEFSEEVVAKKYWEVYKEALDSRD